MWVILLRSAEMMLLYQGRQIYKYVLRDLELKLEEGIHVKRKFLNWKRRQQQKLEKNTEVLDVSELLRNKVLKEHRKKKKQINIQGKNYLQVNEETCQNNMHT